MYSVNSIVIHDVMMRNAEYSAKNLTTANAAKIDNILAQIENQTYLIAYGFSKGKFSPADVNELFRDMLISNKEFNYLTIAMTPEYLAAHPQASSNAYTVVDGKLIIKDIRPLSKDYQYEDWFSIPKFTKQPNWSEPWFYEYGKPEMISSYSFPMLDDTKKTVVGVCRIDLSLKVLQNMVSPIKLLDSGYSVLITRNGTYITHPADSLIMNYSIFSYAKQTDRPELRTLGRKMVAGESGFVKLKPFGGYGVRWMYYTPIVRNGWSMGVAYIEKDIFSDWKRVSTNFSIILALGFIFLLIVVYGRSERIFKPMQQLVKVAENIGKGDFNAELPVIKQHNEIYVLNEAIRSMQAALATYLENLITTNRLKDQIETEIHFAAEFQKNLIAIGPIQFEGINEISVYGIFEPAGEVGGDFYDVFTAGDNMVYFAIADVFGKGIVASMIMTMVQTLLRSKARYVDSLIALMQEINLFLCENNKQSNFVTMLVGQINLQTGTMEYCNSGHTPMYIRKTNKQCIRYGETHSTALGIFPSLTLHSTNIQLEVGDEIIVYTDGITESMNTGEQFYGNARLEETICGIQQPTPEIIANAIFDDVKNFSVKEKPADDISILIIRFNHPKTK